MVFVNFGFHLTITLNSVASRGFIRLINFSFLYFDPFGMFGFIFKHSGLTLDRSLVARGAQSVSEVINFFLAKATLILRIEFTIRLFIISETRSAPLD